MAQPGVRHQCQAGAGAHDGDPFVKGDVDNATLKALHGFFL
jgi:hypothetical protein